MVIKGTRGSPVVLEQLCLVSSGYVKLIKLHRTADMCRHAHTHMSPYKTKYLNKLSELYQYRFPGFHGVL